MNVNDLNNIILDIRKAINEACCDRRMLALWAGVGLGYTARSFIVLLFC